MATIEDLQSRTNAYQSRRNGKLGGASNTGTRVMTIHEAEEWVKCARDPIYFMKRYVKIMHPVRGAIEFTLWPFQEHVIRQLLKNPFNIVKKPRQMGLTWLTAAFIVWMITFFKDKNVLIISIKLGAAIRFLEKIKYIIVKLPDFLQPGVTEASKQILLLDNGSRVESIPTSEEAGRSEGVSFMVFDEAAFIRWMEQIWAAAFPTLSTGGMCLAISTTNGVGNWFHSKCLEAKSGISSFKMIELKWNDHPERGRQWYNTMLAELGELRFAQEVLCDFLASGNPFFQPDVLRNIEECDVMRPISIIELALSVGRKGPMKVPLHVFREPRPGEQFVLSCDPCKGTGKSKTGIEVISLENKEVCATINEKLMADVTGFACAEVGHMYNTASIGVESNVGSVVLRVLMEELDYPDVYAMEKIVKKEGERHVSGEPGFNTNSKTRPHILNELEVATRTDGIIIRDIRIVYEMYNFCYSEGTMRPMARPGYSDDMVLSCAIGNEICVQYGAGMGEIRSNTSMPIAEQFAQRTSYENFMPTNFRSTAALMPMGDQVGRVSGKTHSGIPNILPV